MTTKKPKGWQPGQSGNPKGKTPGSGELQRLRASIATHIPSILDQLVSAAQGGDVQAARLILERVLPPMKAIEQAQELDFPEDGTLTAQGRAVLSAVAAGELAPGQGAALLGAIGTLARVTEIDDLTARITKLEEQQHGNT
jgi:hypothetical protein